MRKLKLTAAIMAICLGTILVGLSAEGITALDNIRPNLSGSVNAYDFGRMILRTTYYFIIILAITVVVFGAMLCRNRKDKGIAITLLVLTAVMLYFQYASINSLASGLAGYIRYPYPEIVVLFVSITVIVLTSCYLGSMKKYWPAANKTAPTTIITSDTNSNIRELEEKTKILKQMKAEGIISEKEFKEKMSLELDKI